ncbi:urease accessory protein UreD [Janthinobacterium fluminis]|uniref:Urease accessory protein UreD n=1 Tax=Janthinobacterium fluminis TaxID=2987524 RepID=A0ABT5K8Y0_9BURK|nr:urease accessory protein UreD [Janthinobacterium fluminis]MDC8760945.1 urease accessory protein UreD [Janthinobacterium fluminis]
MPDCSDSQTSITSGGACQARLALGFADDAGTTRLVERAHVGPLRVQQPLYPEGGAVCHVIVVHPPGGVLGGDQLALGASVGPAARAFLTSPGATKWYKANGQVSRQQVRLHAGAGASVEWMPQEGIFFDAADVALEHSVTLAADASYIGCDIICLGRRASGESFNSGRITQLTQVRRGGRLVWWERGVLAGGGDMLRSPLGLHGHSVCATLLAVGRALPADALAGLREAGADGGARFGLTQMKGVLAARYLGDDSEQARRAMLAVWRRLRPHLLGRAAQVPRIWNT